MASAPTTTYEGPKPGNLDFEISVIADEVPPGGTELVGRVQMNVFKKTGIYGLAVTLAPTNAARILKNTGDSGEKGKKASQSKRFWAVRDTFKYLPFENCCIILEGSKVSDIMDWVWNPMKPREHPVCHYQPGLHEFPFTFDLSSLEVIVGNFEHKCERGFATIENKLFVTVAPSSGSPGLVTFPHKVNLPNYAKLEQGLKKTAETTCCLKKGTQEVVKFALKLNQQGYAFGEEIEFRVEKWQKANTANLVVREMGVSMVRKITVLVPKMQINIFGVYQETKYKQKLLLDKTILSSKNTHSKGPCWTDSFVFPEGIIDTTDMTVDVSYGMELTVNIIGSAQPLRAYLPFAVGTLWDDGPVGSLTKNPWFSVFPRGSLASLNFDDPDSDNISVASSPPNYSTLSSRRPSTETCESAVPPNYSEVLATSTKGIDLDAGEGEGEGEGEREGEREREKEGEGEGEEAEEQQLMN